MYSLRKLGRRLGLGKFILQLNRIRTTGIVQLIKVEVARYRYLDRILQAEPLQQTVGRIEIHMLLHHKRLLEGIWAFYSAARFIRESCLIVVHDDGTLTPGDNAALKRIFPGCRIIARQTADSMVLGRLDAMGLVRCATLRRNFILSLKLFDPFFFSDAEEIIMLDSDVLIYSFPAEILADETHGFYKNSFMLDNHYTHPVPPQDLVTLIGKNCLWVNSGLIRIRRDRIDFKRIERYLSIDDLYLNGKGCWYTEQTLYALELTLADAQALPEEYAICAPNPEKFVAGHYCGGGYWASLFYTRGIPYVASEIDFKGC